MKDEEREHLIDYFAGQILNGVYAYGLNYSDIKGNASIAKSCYDVAEALLKERDSRTKQTGS